MFDLTLFHPHELTGLLVEIPNLKTAAKLRCHQEAAMSSVLTGSCNSDSAQEVGQTGKASIFAE